jgi:hypothetical protein
VYHAPPYRVPEQDENRVIKTFIQWISRRSSHRIKFGGVVGKVTYIAVAVVAGSVAVLAEHNVDWMKGAAVLVIVGFGGYVVRSVLSYASSHPEAMLEGSELLAYHQHVAAKGMESPPDTPPISGSLRKQLNDPSQEA